MNLYPLKFDAILKSIIWGGDDICKFKNIEPQQSGIGESWEISGVEGNISVVAEGELKGKSLVELITTYKEQLVGQKVYKQFGNVFPLLIKFIDACDDLSIQVHPDDELGTKRHNSFGKTEMWYVINSKPGAFLYSGFTKQITPDEYIESIVKDTFVDTLQKHDVKAGDVFFLPAGRVHAIGAGTFIAEIQQTSNITYRIYDYKRTDKEGNPRELHTELAKDAIDYKLYDDLQTFYTRESNKPVVLESCQYFTTNLLDLDTELKQDYSAIDSFVIYICVEGEASISMNGGDAVSLKKGESILLPATAKSVVVCPKDNVTLLETYV